eukprot:TRINITY_DN73002_c0_g1_i1.p1 TRINITY_DN73002_c0_g1~~TRINITY_DN73002_c0_g1_i1.p1  ORF type:complete len:422 (-),score=69.77 TRINITY_DN73002_c0_g1_i1:245-1510(-)
MPSVGSTACTTGWVASAIAGLLAWRNRWHVVDDEDVVETSDLEYRGLNEYWSPTMQDAAGDVWQWQDILRQITPLILALEVLFATISLLHVLCCRRASSDDKPAARELEDVGESAGGAAPSGTSAPSGKDTLEEANGSDDKADGEKEVPSGSRPHSNGLSTSANCDPDRVDGGGSVPSRKNGATAASAVIEVEPAVTGSGADEKHGVSDSTADACSTDVETVASVALAGKEAADVVLAAGGSLAAAAKAAGTAATKAAQALNWSEADVKAAALSAAANSGVSAVSIGLVGTTSNVGESEVSGDCGHFHSSDRGGESVQDLLRRVDEDDGKAESQDASIALFKRFDPEGCGYVSGDSLHELTKETVQYVLEEVRLKRPRVAGAYTEERVREFVKYYLDPDGACKCPQSRLTSALKRILDDIG